MKNIFVILFLLVSISDAANWLMIQGTESKVGHHPWGFLQVKAQKNSGEIVIKDGINKTPFSYIKPTLEKQKELQIGRARIGIRGSFDDENYLNYFVLTELAQNGVNNPLGYSNPSYLIDASLTLKYLPVYLRIGRFKYAGSEEGNMARFTSPFINFSTVGDQLMLERFTDTAFDKPSQGVGAYRDTGFQLFKSFNLNSDSKVTLSYMLGNGSGLAYTNINADNFTHYGYLSYEFLFGKGKGYREEALKLYSWYQHGKRELEDNGVSKIYDRDRYGLGATWFYNSLRVEAEYMKGRGMIFTGAKDIDSNANSEVWNYTVAADKNNEADGYYLLSSYRFFKPLEVLARYDRYNRITNNNTLYRKFDTFTVGFSYIIKAYDRVDINYSFNSIEAPFNSNANELFSKSVGDTISLQYTILIK